MKTKSRLIKIFATVFVAFFVLTGVLSLAACGGSEMTDDDVAALSAAVTKTMEYEGSSTFSASGKIYQVMAEGDEEFTYNYKVNATYSYDSVAGIDYEYYDSSQSYSDYSDSGKSETYILADSYEDGYYTCYEIIDGEKSVYRTTSVNFMSLEMKIYYFDMIGVDILQDISTVEELNGVMLYLKEYMVGSDDSEEDVDVNLKVSGGKYTMSVAFEGGEMSLSVTVKDGMVTKINEYGKMSVDDYFVESSSDIDISYSYDSSLASNFSDLSLWETA